MLDTNFRKGDAKTDVFGSDAMLKSAPVEKIPDGPTTPEIAYQREFGIRNTIKKLNRQLEKVADSFGNITDI